MYNNATRNVVCSQAIDGLVSWSSWDRSGYKTAPTGPHVESYLAEMITTTHLIKADPPITNLFSPVPGVILVDSFISENERMSISPALKFLCNFDQETKMFEMKGVEPYQDILVYGETVKDAWAVLRTEILPILWEEYVNGNAVKLSPKAKKMKNDLSKRVAN